MGEFRNNMASSGTITKKGVSFRPFETVGTKNIFFYSISFCELKSILL